MTAEIEHWENAFTDLWERSDSFDLDGGMAAMQALGARRPA